MAHHIFQKESGVWKKLKKGWVKGDTDWNSLKKGWVKDGTEWKLFFGGGFPKGIILPFYSSGAVPNGWDEYTAPYGRTILGADSSRPPKSASGQSSTTHTGAVATAGTHGGTAAVWNGHFNGDGDCVYCIKYDGDAHEGYNAGGHTHSNITGTVSIIPPKTGLRFLKANTDAGGLPARVSILSSIDLPPVMEDVPAGFTELDFSGRYMGGDNSPAVQDGGTGVHLSSAVLTSYAGSHSHGGVWRTLYTHTNAEYAVNAGNHRHSGYAKADARNYAYRYLSVWYSASAEIAASPNMIGMWEGTSAPEGWTICNGLNGTPDLRNRFVRYGADGNRGTAGGSLSVGLSTYTNTDATHHHRPTTSNANAAAPELRVKHTEAVGHFHQSSTTSKALMPPYYALTFIMKLPE